MLDAQWNTMRTALPLLLGFAVPFLPSCSVLSEDELLEKAQAEHKAGNYQEALKYYEIILDEYPSGKYKSSTLFLLGFLYSNELKDQRAAVQYYREFAGSYPDDKDAPLALFLIGFIYNNELQEFERAKTAYLSFLSQYPDHEMAASAQFELEHLGEDAARVLQSARSEKGNKDASSRVNE